MGGGGFGVFLDQNGGWACRGFLAGHGRSASVSWVVESGVGTDTGAGWVPWDWCMSQSYGDRFASVLMLRGKKIASH